MEACEAFAGEEFEEREEFTEDHADIVQRLAMQFPREIADHDLLETLAYSRQVTATHARLFPAA